MGDAPVLEIQVDVEVAAIALGGGVLGGLERGGEDARGFGDESLVALGVRCLRRSRFSALVSGFLRGMFLGSFGGSM